MAGSPPWFGWLYELVSGLFSGPPAPGTHEARLEEQRVGALLAKEQRKPVGQRDEELVRELRMDYRRRQLQNLQVRPCPRGGGTLRLGEARRQLGGRRRRRSPH